MTGDLEKLIEGCKSKKLKSQSALYQMYSEQFFVLSLKYCKNRQEAQDNLQDSFLEIFKRIEKYKGLGSFEGWMKRIVINKAIDKYKKEMLTTSIHDKADLGTFTEVDEELNISLDEILSTIQQLPSKYRLVFNLYVMDEYSHKEISKLLSISTGTSKSNLHRAKLILKKNIQELKKEIIKLLSMGTKKDIGTVFKEAMSNYSATPDGVWLNIEAQLKRQRRRKLFLLWFLCFFILIPSGLIIYKYTTPSSEIENNKVILTTDPIKDDVNITLQDSDSLTNQAKENTGLTQIVIQKSGIKTFNGNKENLLSRKTNKAKEGNDIISSLEKLNFVRNSLIMKPAIMYEIQQDSLEIILQNPSLGKKKGLSDEEIEEFNGNTFTRFSIQPTISFDNYSAFGRETNKGFTTNQGFYLQYRGTKKVAFRIGYKELNLQYNFQSLTSENQQKVSYTEIPLEVKYSFDNNYSIKPSIITGASYLFLDNASILDINNNSIRLNKGDFRSQMFSLNIGLGLQYQINKRWNVNIESIFKYHPYPYTRSVSFYPYNISASAGIQYSFKF